MTPPTSTKPTLRGLFWFGCGGGALIIGGIIAVLAANWKEIAFPFQVLIALLPLASAACKTCNAGTTPTALPGIVRISPPCQSRLRPPIT